MKIKIIPALLLFIILSGCQYFSLMPYKEWKETNGKDEVDVYVGGSYINGISNIPCYWKNGEKIDLEYITPNANNNVSSIFVDGGDIYCAGAYYDGSIGRACYWKNGKLVKVELSTSNTSWLRSIYVKNGVIFSCGVETITPNNRPFYWINNKQYSLDAPSGASQTYSIYVDDFFNFYIAGNCTSGPIRACYWKNGGECTIMEDILSTAYSIKTAADKLYISGQYSSSNYPCYWIIDGSINRNILPSTAGYSFSIDIYDGNIFSCGTNNTFQTIWSWQNKEILWSKTIINSINASSVFVYDKDIYIAGYDYVSVTKACYWKNGEQIMLPDSGVVANSSSANAIVVKSKI